MTDDDTTQIEEPEQPDEPRRMTRPRDDRVFAGVCSGLNVDPVLFRVAAVALVFFGGAGLLLYVAAVLLIPNEGEEPPEARRRRDRALAVVGVVLLVVAAGSIFSHGLFHFGWAFGPFVFIALAALGVWWLVSGERPRGDGDLARSVARGIGVLILCGALAIGGAWLAGAGGGTAAAIAVIAAGAILAGAALEGYGRWLVLPALALALPVAFVSAANIDLHGGAGDEQYVPTSAAQVRESYRVGAGRLIVDLRDAQLPPGDRRIKLRVGVGDADLIVPSNVCVATDANVGMGVVDSFDRSNGGVDVSWTDQRSAPAGNPRVLLDAHVGVGRVEVSHTAPNDFGPGYHRFYRPLPKPGDEINSGCEVTHAR
jgi:phage shock protein PspC (stress-responsive transcriptional regulator)